VERKVDSGRRQPWLRTGLRSVRFVAFTSLMALFLFNMLNHALGLTRTRLPVVVTFLPLLVGLLRRA